MESERYVCVREQNGETKTVCVVDMSNPSQVLRRPISADAAIMNPSKNILALTGKSCFF